MSDQTRLRATVFVGGLDNNVNESTLHDAFIPFGEIVDVNMPKPELYVCNWASPTMLHLVQMLTHFPEHRRKILTEDLATLNFLSRKTPEKQSTIWTNLNFTGV